VIVCATEVEPKAVAAKVRPLGESKIVGGGTPVPVSKMVCGEPVALSVAARLAVAAPSAVGLNPIHSMQLAPAASEVEQVLSVSRKSLALAPVKR